MKRVLLTALALKVKSGSSPVRVKSPDQNLVLQEKQVSSPAPSAATFDWGAYVAKVQSLSDAVYSQLMKTNHEIVSNTLHIYPHKKIVKSILARDNNKRILVDAANGIKVVIHDAEESQNNQMKDETLAKISAIMGGEVQNDGGGNPFGE